MASSASGTAGRTVYGVSELAEILRSLLEDSLPGVWVQGEISNFAHPASGHWYFTLKDSGAQLRCAMFRGNNFNIRPMPANGDQVLVRGRVSLYPGRGDLQLICEYLEPAGSGALLRAFERLKQKLASEGLFDASGRRPIPVLPHRIGLITSASGAAVHDVLTTLGRRWPLATVVLAPVAVQGAAAAPAIVRALAELPRLGAPLDLILLVRGGGSLEDLWAFNEETVARAIRACPVPVVTGIGHETDFTIADFAADLRAATPTAAAECTTPDAREWLRRIDRHRATLEQHIQRRLSQRQVRLEYLQTRLQQTHPARRLRDRTQRLDDLDLRLRQIMSQRVSGADRHLTHIGHRLQQADPSRRLRMERQRLYRAHQLLALRIRQHLQSQLVRLQRGSAVLDSLSPLAVLGRGYALVMGPNHEVIHDSRQVEVGARLDIRLARGRLEATTSRCVEPEDVCAPARAQGRDSRRE